MPNLLFNFASKADGTAFPSMLSTLMEMNTDSKAIDANDIAIAKTILVVYAAGTDTVRPQSLLY